MKKAMWRYGKYGFLYVMVILLFSAFQNDIQANIFIAPQSKLVSYSYEYLLNPSLIAFEPNQSSKPEIEETHNKPLLYNVAENPLAKDYRPDDLVAFADYDIKVTSGAGKEEGMARKIMMVDLKNLIAFCEKETEQEIYIRSGFRSYWTQKTTYGKYGERSSAYPGTSEHQLGVAIDIEPHKYKSREFLSKTHPVYTCFVENAHEYGFIQSYFKGNSYGIIEEPWHWRYVGSIFSRQLIADGHRTKPETLFGIDSSYKKTIVVNVPETSQYAASQKNISEQNSGIISLSHEDAERIQELRKKVNRLEFEERVKAKEF